MNETIKVGDKVRSFDFADGDYGRTLEGERACYFEGEVVEISDRSGAGYETYMIDISRRVWGGNEMPPKDDGAYVFAPVNGTKKGFAPGEHCDGVELI